MTKEEILREAHRRAALARFRNVNELEIRLRTGLGFYAAYAFWNLETNQVRVRSGKNPITIEECCHRVAVKIAKMKAKDLLPETLRGMMIVDMGAWRTPLKGFANKTVGTGSLPHEVESFLKDCL